MTKEIVKLCLDIELRAGKHVYKSMVGCSQCISVVFSFITKSAQPSPSKFNLCMKRKNALDFYVRNRFDEKMGKAKHKDREKKREST